MLLISIATSLIKAWPLVARRAIAGWPLLSTVIIGVLLASAIMAGTVIYFDALRELALTRALDELTVDETNILLKSDQAPTTRVEATKVVQATNREIDRSVAWLLRNRVQGVKSATFFVTEPGQELTAGIKTSRTYFFNVPTIYEYITILPGGRTPASEPVSLPGEPLTLEALAPAAAAEAFGVGLGDQLSASPDWSDSLPYVRVKIVGLYVQNEPSDAFWHFDKSILRVSESGTFRTIPFLITEEAYFDILGNAFADMNSTYGWLLAVDRKQLNSENATFARLSIDEMRLHLFSNLFNYLQFTSLVDALEEYDTRLFFSKLPMFVILTLIAVVVLYYVITLSSLLVEQQRSEIILLRSRGASSVQVLAVLALEGATISLIAIIVAPFLAALVISLLGYTPMFSNLSGSSRLDVSLSTGAYVMSAIGGLLSFSALMVPAVQSSRITVTTHHQQSARPSSQPLYQRLYLDVLLLAIGILLFRQLSQMGSVVAVDAFGAVAADQLLLAVPVVILVASALVMLRLFPLVMRVASRLLSPVLPVGLAVGLWQMARNPTHYARLSLLLILMAGLGTFSASFGGTFRRSFEERALYSTGADIRIEDVRLSSLRTSMPLVDTYEGLPSVTRVGIAFRGSGSDLSQLFASSYTMFAIDGEAIMDVGWFRDDFADGPLRPKVTSLSNPTPPQGIVLPAGSAAIGVAIKADRPHPGIVVAARIKDTNGRYFSYILGGLESSEWLRLETGFERVSRLQSFELLQPIAPLSLVSLTLHESESRNRLRAGSVAISEVYVKMANGDTKVVEPFDSVAHWSVLETAPESVSDVWQPAGEVLKGDTAANFTWTEGSPLVSRGVFPGPPMVPLDVVASKSFLSANKQRLGETIQVTVQGHRLNVSLVDEIDYFPTFDTDKKSYLIGDLDSIFGYVNLQATGAELRPNEIWLSTEGDSAERSQLLDMLNDDQPFANRVVHDRLEALSNSRADPLVDAGWKALLFVAFAAVFVLSGIGFLVHAYVSFKGREVQFALMRTIGFTMGQLMTLVFIEQALVIGTGLALGTWMGGRLSATVMPFLGHDDRGIQVLPPFVNQITWDTLAITYAAMGLLFAFIVAGVIWFLRRLSLQRILRLGEM